MRPNPPLDVLLPDRPSLLVDVHMPSGAEPARMVLTGELEGGTAVRFQNAVMELLRQRRPRHIEVDLAGVTFLDTEGIRSLVLCRADARQVECGLSLIHPQPLVYRILRIVGLLQTFGLTGPIPTVPAQSTGAGSPMRLTSGSPR